MTDEAPEREAMAYDLVIVGGGPAGLSAAIKFKQLATEANKDISVVLIEKGSEIGAHILSGVVIDPIGLHSLWPDWQDGCPVKTKVKTDKYKFLSPNGSFDISWLPMPGFMKNHGNYVGSLANVCRWLGQKAEDLGVEIYPGYAASEVVYSEDGAVKGVVAGVMGIGRDGKPKNGHEPGMELHGKYVLFAEGARGSLSKQLIEKFDLAKGRDVQKYGLGLKEVWSVPEKNFQEGFVQHTLGWPLDDRTGGGSFLYHFKDGSEYYVSLGFVVHLNYKNPYISPYHEFQRWKHHKEILPHIDGGKRTAYGARAIVEGGFQSVPKLIFPGGALIGCAAGFVNVPRIKGSHNAILSGIMAAQAAFEAVSEDRSSDLLEAYEKTYESSSVYKELKGVRNVKPLLSKLGTFWGTMVSGVEMWVTKIFGGFSFFGTLKHGKSDAESLGKVADFKSIEYPKPDGVISFDKLTNVSFTNTNHEEDQPIHLKVLDDAVQQSSELAEFGGPCERYCPAGVYEWVEDGDSKRLQINAQNCIHCKTCDIKDPNQNINWTVPEGGGGPNYTNT